MIDLLSRGLLNYRKEDLGLCLAWKTSNISRKSCADSAMFFGQIKGQRKGREEEGDM